MALTPTSSFHLVCHALVMPIEAGIMILQLDPAWLVTFCHHILPVGFDVHQVGVEPDRVLLIRQTPPTGWALVRYFALY